MSRTHTVRRPRRRSTVRLAAGAAAVVAAAGLTGCATMSQQTTELIYDAADGISGNVGQLHLSDVHMVTTADEGPAKMGGMATNKSNGAVQLTISAQGAGSKTVTVPAGQSVRLNGEKSGDSPATVPAVVFTGLKQKPGDTVNVAYSTGSGGTTTLPVPLLLDQYPYGTATLPHPTAPTPSEGGGH